MSDGELRDAIRELHKPFWHQQYSGRSTEQVWHVCRGCDDGPHAEGPPSWPCQTAGLVYTADEIAAREPQVPECPHDHRTFGEGPPVQAQAVFMRLADGRVEARRWKCDHVPGVPVTSSDPWE